MSSASPYTRVMGGTCAPHPSVMDPVARRRPRYRWRTWMRGHVPWALVDLFPKGLEDCGQHEWHNYDDKVDRCYHCEVGVRPHRPIHAPIDDNFRLMLVRAAERGDEVAAELVESFHGRDRELGRPRWHPPAE
jgi:hypothetical protein